MEDEIGLRWWLLTVLKRKKLVIGLTLLVVAGRLAVVVPAPKYKATATVVMCGLRYAVEFAPSFKTTQERENSRRGPTPRSKGLLALVRSDAVAQAALDAVKSQLGDKHKTAASLLGRLDVKREGNVIDISFWDDDPQRAAIVANAWAEKYAKHANQVYSAAFSGELLRSAEAELESAKQRYIRAERALTDFTAANTIAALDRRISWLGGCAGPGAESKVTKAEPPGLAVTDESKSMLGVLKRAKLDSLGDYYADRRRTRRLLIEARSLAEQIGAEAPGSPGSALALLLLKQRVHALESTWPAGEVQWQLDLDRIAMGEKADVEAEIAGVVNVLVRRLKRLDGLRDEASRVLASDEEESSQGNRTDAWFAAIVGKETAHNLEAAIETIETEVVQLQGQLAEQNAQKKQVTASRDQAWRTYETLSSKVEELHTANRIFGVEVKVASRAAVPSEPSRSYARPAAVALVLGLVLSCVFAGLVQFVADARKGD